MSVHDRLKVAWHRDLASNPVTHGWILNLYRAGEQHPQTVLDYFPAEHAPWPELASSLRRHAADERKHTALYGRAIERLGQPVVEMDVPDVFNHEIRKQTPVRWAIAGDEAEDERRDKLASFLAHAHHLEIRVARSLEYHAEACAQLGRDEVGETVARVLADEERHASYTREAVYELVPRERALALDALHAASVARADRSFSARQVAWWYEHHRQTVGPVHRLLWRTLGKLMEAEVG